MTMGAAVFEATAAGWPKPGLSMLASDPAFPRGLVDTGFEGVRA